MEVNKNGKLAYTDHNSKTNETTVGGGSWKYNGSTGKWNLSTQTSLISGAYSIVGTELVCKTTFEDGSHDLAESLLGVHLQHHLPPAGSRRPSYLRH